MHKSTECHVTPLPVAYRMVDYLDATPDQLTLEPSAGTGNLIQALIDSGHTSLEIVPIENNLQLHIHLFMRFKEPNRIVTLNQCFLEYAEQARHSIEFSRIVMNPPFSKVRQHIKAAVSLMGPGGHATPAILIALVPSTYKDLDHEVLEELPVDTFATVKVSTKIIKITRST